MKEPKSVKIPGSLHLRIKAQAVREKLPFQVVLLRILQCGLEQERAALKGRAE